MRVLFVASFADSLIRFRGSLISAMRERDIDVVAAAPGLSKDAQIREALERQGVVTTDIPLRRTGTNPFADLWLLWSLFCLMRRIRPDCVIGYTVKPVIYGSLAAWLAAVPHRFALVTGLGYAFTDGRKDGIARIVRTLLQIALSKVEKVFFQNPDDQADFRELGILTRRVPSVIISGSGVDVDSYNVVPLPSAHKKFLMIARLLGDKGVREYAQAAREVRAQHPDTVFGLVGWIDENPDAIRRSELDKWVSDGVVEYYGRLDDVRPAIAGCGVYVLPSYREGTPRTVLEAMAMGRPVITTDAPGCRETVIDGDNGFLVPVKSVDRLVAAMMRFIDQPELVGKMGLRSRQIAEEKYDVRKVNEIMLREMGINE